MNNKPSWKTLLILGVVLLLVSGGFQFIIAIVGIILVGWALVEMNNQKKDTPKSPKKK